MAEEKTKSNEGPTVGIRTSDVDPKKAADKKDDEKDVSKVPPFRAAKRDEADGKRAPANPQTVSGGELKGRKAKLALDNREGDQAGVPTDEFVPQQVDGPNDILPGCVARDTHE